MILESGQQFSHFKIIRKLGEGGMGEVYLAEDQKLGRNVALKILHAEFFENPDRLERFNREAKTAAKISNSNVMSIYDIGAGKLDEEDRELGYIVMEYVEGQSLTDYLKMPSVTIKDLLRIAEKSASGLASAHKLNIVHRDIKTDNIRIDPEGEPKILDFGLAKPVAAAISGGDDGSTDTVSQELTQEGHILGTVAYMSPEQARGEAVDSRSDIFSFGILLYKMFTGEFPFEGPDKVSTLAKILEAKHTPPRQKNESLPSELDRIIDKCLQKDPNDRYQDTRDLVVDLRSLRRQFESGLSDTASIITDSYKQAKAAKGSKKRLVNIGLSVVGVVLVALVLSQILSSSDTQPISGLQAKENALAILGFENKTGDKELDWLQAGLPEILLTDLAQGGAKNIISRTRVLDCLSDEDRQGNGLPNHERCIDAARSLGASTVLSGSFFKLGDMIRIDARLEDAETGKIILGEKVVGDDPFALVDSLTQKVAQSLNMQEIMASNVSVAGITSSSPEAYKEYILGMNHFIINEAQATKHFQKAIELDSTFALPYMRLAMSHVFEGRNQLAAEHFALANMHADKLPVKERTLLDIYSDIWLRMQYDDAMSKTEAYLNNYPDDKETRGYYALLLNVLKKDPYGALAQLDTVMMLDEDFYPALNWYADIYLKLDEYDKSIEYAKRAISANPQAPGPYAGLIRIYFSLGRMEEAEQACLELLELKPNDYDALVTLVSIYEIRRDFETADQTIERIRAEYSDDPFKLSNYYGMRANYEFWFGRFHSGMDYRFKALETVMPTNDSTQITSRLGNISTYYRRLGMIDSCLYYAEEALQYANRLSKMNYPLLIAMYDRERLDKADTILRSNVDEFKASVPKDLWYIPDFIEELFEALKVQDTAQMIDIHVRMQDSPNMQSSENLLVLGELMLKTGDYEGAMKYLEELRSEENENANAYRNIATAYFIGRVQEALGNTQQAVKEYREVLKYWGKPEIELDEISETRSRLGKLTSS